MWLWSAACLSPIQRTLDPGLKADQPHQNHPFVINLSQSGKLLGGGKWGRSMFSRVGEWCLNTKINFFHFQKHYLFIIFKVFIFFGRGETGRCTELTAVSWVTVASESCAAPLSAHGRQGQGARLRTHSRQLCPDPRDGQARKSKLRNWHGRLWSVSVWGELTRNTQLTFSFFAFVFIKEKGACQLSSPVLHDSLCCIVLFCFVNCIIFKYLSFKKRRKTKKNLVKALRRG